MPSPERGRRFGYGEPNAAPCLAKRIIFALAGRLNNVKTEPFAVAFAANSLGAVD